MILWRYLFFFVDNDQNGKQSKHLLQNYIDCNNIEVFSKK